MARQLNCGGVARVSWAFASMAESEGGKMVGEGRPDSDSFGLILQFDAIWEAVRMMDGSIHAAPRQGPPAPSLQGVICSSSSSCCCCCCWSNILG